MLDPSSRPRTFLTASQRALDPQGGLATVARMSFTVLLGVVLVALLFLAARELWCWYWKINEAITLGRSIETKLQALTEAVRQQTTLLAPAPPTPRAVALSDGLWPCRACGAPMLATSQACPVCKAVG